MYAQLELRLFDPVLKLSYFTILKYIHQFCCYYTKLSQSIMQNIQKRKIYRDVKIKFPPLPSRKDCCFFYLQ